jgi:hypothetical protein
MTVSITDQAYCTNLLELFLFLLATVEVALFLILLGRFSLFMRPRSKGAMPASLVFLAYFNNSKLFSIYFLFLRHKNSGVY